MSPSTLPHNTFERAQTQGDRSLLPGARVLAVCTMHLLGTSSFLAWLARNLPFNLLKCALNLVLEMWLSLVMCSWSALLGYACSGCALLGRYLLSGCSFALALWCG